MALFYQNKGLQGHVALTTPCLANHFSFVCKCANHVQHAIASLAIDIIIIVEVTPFFAK